MILDPTPAQLAFQSDVAAFASSTVEPAAARIDEAGEFPHALLKAAGDRGLMGVTVPAAWGGGGRDYVSYALAVDAVSQASATVGVILVVQNSLVGDVLARFGTDAQREQWLRPIATGHALGAFALSEENAGTDAANVEMDARPVEDGRAYVLNGRKVWVACAEGANVAIVLAATRPGMRAHGITAFLVPMSTPGIERMARADSLGVRGLGCMDLAFTDVRVPADQVLGPVNEGFKLAMWALEGGRVGIAAQALGIGQAALDAALHHVKARHTFGKAIADYQAVQFMLSDMATELEAARILTYKAAALKPHQPSIVLEAAQAKLAASIAAHQAADKAMQILASAGYRRGSKVERLFRDARATEIYQGTSETQRMVIAERVLGVRR
ncbi:MAG: acyl-CoA dehydrogenase family protein [Vicinamibacterales bacterium]|nr:acyl-CoA dehydrogenase family protein [Vicinamibacterales bacterium]